MDRSSMKGEHTALCGADDCPCWLEGLETTRREYVALLAGIGDLIRNLATEITNDNEKGDAP